MSSRVADLNGTRVMSPRNALYNDEPGQVLDSEWTQSAFLISDASFTVASDLYNRYKSSAHEKFTDGRLGCNIGINARPQYTRYSDIRAKGRNSSRADVNLAWTQGNIGLGRYYSEAIDDPSQTIYMRFGVPQFSGLLSFLSRAFDADMVTLARTGRATSLLYTAGKTIGTVTGIIAFPQIAAAIMLGKAVDWVWSRPTSKFYTMKPTMYTYWATVENLVNNIAVTRGLLPRVIAEGMETGDRLGQPYRIDPEQLRLLNELMPEVFGGKTGSDNYINVTSIVNRAQRAANLAFLEAYENVDKATATNFEGYLRRDMTGDGTTNTYVSNADNGPIQRSAMGDYSIGARLNYAFTFGNYKQEGNQSKAEINPQAFPKAPDTADAKAKDVGQDRGFLSEYIRYMDDEFRDGSQFAVFKVDHTGSVQEGFSNAAQESDLSSGINNISSKAKQMRFSVQDGNMTGSVFEEMLQGVVGGAADVAKGVLDGVTFGFSNIIAGLAGSGYIDIPKNWQSSSAQLPRASYTIQLVSPYGNIISQIQNLYIPLCMLLAGSLPISVGKAAYTSPYLCQVYDRGRCQITLGMIESLSITRGTSNLAFNTKGNPLAIDVSFTVMDLSSIMHMPISSGGLFETDTNMDSDNIMADYISVLAGQDLYTQLYAMPAAQLRLAKEITKGSRLTSPSAWAAATHASLPTIVRELFEAGNRGSSVVSGGINLRQ